MARRGGATAFGVTTARDEAGRLGPRKRAGVGPHHLLKDLRDLMSYQGSVTPS